MKQATSQPTDRPGIAAIDYYLRLKRVRIFVEAHLDQPLPVSRVAPIAGLGRKYFSTYFRRRVGLPYRAWLLAIRVRHAQRLLRSTELSVTDVAWEVGYDNLRSFQRAFKQTTGMTPMAFKRASRHTPQPGNQTS